MIKSMTGFGRVETSGKYGRLKVEIRSVNFRSLDVAVRLPEDLVFFEPQLKGLIQKDISRGRINFSLTFFEKLKHRRQFFLDEELALIYHRKLARLQRRLKLNKGVVLDDILPLPGVISFTPIKDKQLAALWPEIKKTIRLALRELLQMRSREGRFLAQDLGKRIQIIKRSLLEIKRRLPRIGERYRRHLSRRLQSVGSLDKSRIDAEVAIFAQNSDVSEELTRLLSHLLVFQKNLRSGGAVGKKLDFIAQEIQREANTIGAKAGDYQVSREVIEIKSEIEKIREQVQNVE